MALQIIINDSDKPFKIYQDGKTVQWKDIITDADARRNNDTVTNKPLYSTSYDLYRQLPDGTFQRLNQLSWNADRLNLNTIYILSRPFVQSLESRETKAAPAVPLRTAKVTRTLRYAEPVPEYTTKYRSTEELFNQKYEPVKMSGLQKRNRGELLEILQRSKQQKITVPVPPALPAQPPFTKRAPLAPQYSSTSSSSKSAAVEEAKSQYNLAQYKYIKWLAREKNIPASVDIRSETPNENDIIMFPHSRKPVPLENKDDISEELLNEWNVPVDQFSSGYNSPEFLQYYWKNIRQFIESLRNLDDEYATSVSNDVLTPSQVRVLNYRIWNLAQSLSDFSAFLTTDQQLSEFCALLEDFGEILLRNESDIYKNLSSETKALLKNLFSIQDFAGEAESKTVYAQKNCKTYNQGRTRAVPSGMPPLEFVPLPGSPRPSAPLPRQILPTTRSPRSSVPVSLSSRPSTMRQIFGRGQLM